jgi:hypothetical protein
MKYHTSITLYSIQAGHGTLERRQCWKSNNDKVKDPVALNVHMVNTMLEAFMKS